MSGLAAAGLLSALLALVGCDAGEVTDAPGGGGGGSGGGGSGGGAVDAGDEGGGGGGGGDAGGAWEAELVFCVEETNRYRAMLELAPLERSAALEEYAAEGARIDHESGQPHKHFSDTGGGGIAFAENELPGWNVSQLGSVQEVIRAGLAQMWAEGPGGGHHDNMAGDYATLGCGIYLDGDRVTVVQDFGF